MPASTRYLIGAAVLFALILTIWVVRGRYADNAEVATTAVNVERIQTHENDIALNPLGGPAVHARLLHHGRF